MRWRPPDTIFARLAILLVLAFMVSQLLIWLAFATGFGHGLPPIAVSARTAPPIPWREILIDQCITLACVLVAIFVGAKWIAAPIRQLAREAMRVRHDLAAGPLAEHGPLETRQAAEVMNRLRERVLRQITERQHFLAAISHDLRTPLTRIRLRTELMSPPALQEKTRKDIVEMTEMLDQALDFLRGERLLETKQWLDIQALIETIAEDLRECGQAVSCFGQAAPFLGYPLALKRCIENIVGNAIRYGEAASIALVDTGNELCIEVVDQGPGIPDAYMEAVLEPFIRLETSRSRERGGVGLGLAIAREVAEQHEGRLILRNGEARGLHVIIALPRRFDYQDALMSGVY
ncbi:sensor histidine kinase [Chitinimonas sp.]|uniref:sensor histidine kinase n=1 Tax=Chitinimonas sp. TaxID=1934313 RepID=UPI0035AF6E31